MRAVTFPGNRQMLVNEVPDPIPGAGEVRVKVAYALPGTTDLAAWQAGSTQTPGSAVAGVIDGVGSGVSGMRHGQRVVVYAPRFCGNCPHCWSGLTNVCPNLRGNVGQQSPGGFAEYVVVADRNAVDLPVDIETADGTLFELVGAVSHGLRQAMRVTKDSSAPALILGFDTMGMIAAQLLKTRGYRDVAAYDALPARQQRAQAAELNAAHAGWRYPLVVETSGQFDLRMRALREVDNGGAVLFLGGNDQTWPVTPDYRITHNDFFAVHTFAFPLGELRLVQDDLRAIRTKLAPLLAERRPLETWGAAFAAYAQGEMVAPILEPGSPAEAAP